jgi:hypothetical protein
MAAAHSSRLHPCVPRSDGQNPADQVPDDQMLDVQFPSVQTRRDLPRNIQKADDLTQAYLT